jgi:aryl-alcohol dehydrogenase-like predicted oxidoreductase
LALAAVANQKPTRQKTNGSDVDYAILGSTGLRVSRLAFGAGPVSGVMVEEDARRQEALVRRVLDAGVNWIDTAATYGDGRSEQAVGASLAALGAAGDVHIATKVRLFEHQLSDIRAAVRESVAASLQRLCVKQVTLLQVHNSITARRGDEPTSLTPNDVLGPGGLLEALGQLREDGVVRFFGLTAIGQPGPLREVIESGQFHTIQVPYNLMNPSAGQDVPADFQEANYGNVIAAAALEQMGVFVIRVYAGGVLTGSPPSRHTLTTKFFPMELFKRDELRVAKLRDMRLGDIAVKELALRYSLSHPSATSAIVGFGEPGHVDEAVRYLNAGPLSDALLARLRSFEYHRVR